MFPRKVHKSLRLARKNMRHELPVLSQGERTETQDYAHVGNKDIISVGKKSKVLSFIN